MTTPTVFTWMLTAFTSPVQPTADPFDPVRVDFAVHEQGLELTAYDAQGEVVGVLIAEPNTDHVRIVADFDDGYAAFGLSFRADEPVQDLHTNLGRDVITERFEEMFSFAPLHMMVPVEGASHEECMWIFAGLAATCGGALLFPPVSPLTSLGCLTGLGGALCSCGDHLPIDLCP